jgi:polyisoprenoid-binding protein YceI
MTSHRPCPTSSLSWFLALGVAALTGCSDPAENVHKAPASSPVVATPAASAAGKEYVVRSSSKIEFEGSKVTGSHKGGFKNFAGTLQVADGKILGQSVITINMQSTWADNNRLEGHLKSADFFDVGNHPKAVFTVTSIQPEGARTKITGNLALHGVTKSISFPADLQIGADEVTLKAEFAINRKDFNINYPGKPDDLIRDQVVIRLDIRATPGPAGPEDRLASLTSGVRA